MILFSARVVAYGRHHVSHVLYYVHDGRSTIHDKFATRCPIGWRDKAVSRIFGDAQPAGGVLEEPCFIDGAHEMGKVCRLSLLVALLVFVQCRILQTSDAVFPMLHFRVGKGVSQSRNLACSDLSVVAVHA